MAEKEERILILTGNKDNYPAWNYSRGPLYLDEEYYDGISRTEAIEKMAKGIHFYEWAHDKHFPKWNELNSDIQNDYKNMAEAALDALLEDK